MASPGAGDHQARGTAGNGHAHRSSSETTRRDAERGKARAKVWNETAHEDPRHWGCRAKDSFHFHFHKLNWLMVPCFQGHGLPPFVFSARLLKPAGEMPS